eukprot:CAMPEP_0174741396 /NCGR_PEP_ID=MMETSP1094-20130205/76223_1 /TAXON_ID=156173 /ORGANISM="Chrysochromulina brevifilum, Strain UTEX LB 985" /LENGTH=79 /DNA_ID=CAMNT_0015945273 /DNA_START=44 /DNA_END=280 /DNA_ORIENTATION=-
MAERSWKRANELAAASTRDKGAEAHAAAAARGSIDREAGITAPMHAALREAATALLGQTVELFGLSSTELNGRRGLAVK